METLKKYLFCSAPFFLRRESSPWRKIGESSPYSAIRFYQHRHQIALGYQSQRVITTDWLHTDIMEIFIQRYRAEDT